MVRRKKRDTAKCPRCDCEVEDGEHVLRCKGPSAREAWTAALEKLQLSLLTMQTATYIVSVLRDGLNHWYEETPRPDAYYTEDVRTALRNQDSIGWRALLEGCPAVGWAEAQQSYFERWKSKRTGQRWAAAMTVKMMDTAWDMWDHPNSVEKEDATSQESQEDNKRIVAEYQRRFAGLDRKALKLTGQSMDRLLKKQLEYRKAWLLSVDAACGRAEHRQQRNMPPQSALETIGYVEWRRQLCSGFTGYRDF